MNNISPIKINQIPLKNFRLNSPNLSFCASKKDCFENQSISEAVDFGYKLYESPDCFLKEIITAKMPDVKIIFTEDKDSNIDADLSYNHTKNFEAVNFRLRSSHNLKSDSRKRKMLCALAFAHEYTHYLQHKSKDYQDFMRNLTDNDYDYLRCLVPLGCGIFDEFDGKKFAFTRNIFNILDLVSEKIYSVPPPRKQSFKKADILASMGMKTKKEFEKYMQIEFDEIFSATVEMVIKQPKCADKSIRDFIFETIRDGSKYKRLKNTLKAYCALKAKHEKEAYKTECLLARKIFHTDKSLNIDSYVMYYSMLEKALK